jgi:hypothetical protein
LPDRWYPDGTDTDGGWIAVTDGLHDYVTPALPRCPATVNTENVEAMLPAEWLWCFDKLIVLERFADRRHGVGDPLHVVEVVVHGDLPLLGLDQLREKLDDLGLGPGCEHLVECLPYLRISFEEEDVPKHRRREGAK